MAKPSVEIYSPTNLTPTSAFLHGKCHSMGGLPTKFCFQYFNPFWWKTTPLRDVDHDGETFHENIENVGWKLLRPPSPIKYKWPLRAQAAAYNADGYAETPLIPIWLPKPTDPKLGAPWAITAFGGSCYNHSYSFAAFTDIACRLTAYIGRRKPWVSPTTHITKGVVFHHDAIVIFRYDDALNQAEPGDARTHTYDYEYPFYGHAYWILFIGTVDGKDSPSISAPYRFLCVPPPIMTIDDAFDITHESARLPGHLVDDKGLPVYCRFNYGISPDYTHNTPTLGPARSPCYYTQLITDLEPETEYRFRAEGSHEIAFPYHGISRPKDFFTLPAPLLPPLIIHASSENFWAEGHWLAPYEAAHDDIGRLCHPGSHALYSRQVQDVNLKWWIERAAFVFDTRDLDPDRPINKATITFYCSTKWAIAPYDMYFVNANDLTLPATIPSFHELLRFEDVVLIIPSEEFTVGSWISKDLTDTNVINPGQLTIIGIRESHDFFSDSSPGPPFGSMGVGVSGADFALGPPYLTLR